MDIIEKYGDLITNNINNKVKCEKLIKFGISMENIRVHKFSDKSLPTCYQYLNKICLEYMLEGLNSKNDVAWVNLFFPCEILDVFGINPLLIEAYSSFLTGLKCENSFIDYADKNGIADTLCSYHRGFIGAGLANVLKKPLFSASTTTICDGYINSFKLLSNKYSIPNYILDIPYNLNEENIIYVENQIKNLVKNLEISLNKKFDEDKLKHIIKKENQTNRYRREYLNSLKTKHLPSTLTLEMYMMFTSHIFIGRDKTNIFYKMLSDEIKTAKDRTSCNILWIHNIPFYHKTLKEYFNQNENYNILTMDLNYDYYDEMDYKRPYRALAIKSIANHSNGNFNRKLASIDKIIDATAPEGIINFSNWGCKQSSGGVYLLKDFATKKGIPFLNLDGDGVDRRNSHDGQVRTRLEAFFEIIRS
ncbi:MAG: 2-hydroxyacyl-CoA dehydratase subunit D [Clostridiaceae bacterium]